MTQLYHRLLGFPRGIAMPCAGMPLRYSRHALNAADHDGLKRLPTTLPDGVWVVEIEVFNGTAVKWVVRMASELPNEDLVLAVLPDGFVKTVWLNHRLDSHRTLDITRYAIPGSHLLLSNLRGRGGD